MGATELTAWQRVANLFRSRYVQYLEAENERLRNQVLDMTNSLLTHTGMPTIGQRERKPMPPIQGRMMPSQLRTKFEAFDRKKAESTKEA